MPLLEVKDLSLQFTLEGKSLPVVSGLSFSLEKGEVLAIVGESGCGKSVTCMSLAKLLPEPPAKYSSGEIIINTEKGKINVFSLSKRQLRKIRGGRIAYIFQEPSVSLNPVFKIGEQIAEAVVLHRPEVKDVRTEVVRLLSQVGISDPDARVESYPHEMSGGMQQRVMIAMALASRPEILVADEPTTALDVTIQAQILELLKDLRKKEGMSIIIVTHNLGIVSETADRVIVMYAGNNVESASTEKIINDPLHPYTKALLAAVPKLGHKGGKLTSIPGNVPSPENYPAGCRFCGRCTLFESLTAPEDKALCETKVPEWEEKAPGHFCRCWHVSMKEKSRS